MSSSPSPDRRAWTALRRWAARGALAALALVALSWWMGRRMPAPSGIRPEILRAPVQQPTAAAPFDFEYKGKRCEVRPRAEYELRGLVVSHNDIRSFSDIYHDATSVDTRDLCVAWGPNLENGAYLEAEFWSGPFTCYFRTPADLEFDAAGISNNHLITDRPELRAALERLHVGDQVRLRGLLVDYRMDDWGDFWRRTSMVRDDSGCEVIFLEELEVLDRNAPAWHAARRIATALLVLLPLAWLSLFVAEARRGGGSVGRL